MKNSVICYGDFQNLQTLHAALLRRGRFDFSFAKCSTLQELADLCKTGEGDKIVSCKNDQIDSVLDELQTPDAQASLIFEQAIKLEKEDSKILLIPSELDPEQFLNEFLEEKTVFSCSVFGKSVGFVRARFEEFCKPERFDYEIITKSQFLHTIYYSKYIDKQILTQTFGEGVFAFEDTNIEAECAKLLQEKSLAVAEQITSGGVSACLVGAEANLSKVKIVSSVSDLQEFGLAEDFVAEKGFVSKEVAFAMAKSLLSSCDVALSVLGSFEEGQKTYVAVGDKESVHLFSSSFMGSRKQILENITNFALFRLLKFLEEKSV